MAEPRRRDPARLGLFERLLLSVMGPPQVGDVHAPRTAAPDPAAARCHRCGQPWEDHERVHTGSVTYRRCPAGPA